MGHITKQLTEAELIAEIQEISGGAKSSFEQQAMCNNVDAPLIVNSPQIIPKYAGVEFRTEEPKRKRGRTKGSKNKPKEAK